MAVESVNGVSQSYSQINDVSSSFGASAASKVSSADSAKTAEKASEVSTKDRTEISEEAAVGETEDPNPVNMNALTGAEEAGKSKEDEIAEELGELADEDEVLEAQEEDLQEEIEAKKAELEQLKQERTHLQDELEAAKQSGDQAKVAELQARLGENQAKINEVRGDLSDLRSDLKDVQQARECNLGDQQNLMRELQAAAQQSNGGLGNGGNYVAPAGNGGGYAPAGNGGGSCGGGGSVGGGGGNYGGGGSGAVGGSNPVGSYSGYGPSESGNAVAALAEKYLGRDSYSLKGDLPNFTAAGGRNNNCADFVSSLLETTGQLHDHEINVRGLEEQLIQEGWVQVSAEDAQPGDVWMNDQRGHTEIVEKAGNPPTLIGSNNGGDHIQEITRDTSSGRSGVFYHNPANDVKPETKTEETKPAETAKPAAETASSTPSASSAAETSAASSGK